MFWIILAILVTAYAGFIKWFWPFSILNWGAISAFTVWLLLCFRIIGPTEKAIAVILGKPWRMLRSGPNFIIWPLENLVTYPTKQQELELKPIKVITKKEDTAQNSEDNEHSAAEIEVKPTFYFFWPDDFAGLKNALVKGASPETAQDRFQEAIYNALRSVIIQNSWVTCYSDPKGITDKVLDILCCSDGSPIQEAGIPRDDIFLAIEIALPKELVQSLTAPEIAALKAKAREREGKGEKKFILAQKQAEAEGRTLVFNSIGDQLAKEAFLTLREMAKGTSNTILFGLPPELYETVKAATKGTDPEAIFKFLPDEQKKKVIEFVQSLNRAKGGDK